MEEPKKELELSTEESVEEEDASPAPAPSSRYGVSQFVSINTWGVKDRAGEWIEVKDHPWRATHDAKNIPQREALGIFERHPAAFQLIDGCDWWACLDDSPEILVVKKEKKDVPTSESVPGAGTVGDGSGHPEEARTPTEDSFGGDD